MAEETDDVAKTNEEQEVRDSDADTSDVERDTNSDYEKLLSFMEKIDARMNALEGSLENLRGAQSIMIDNGAVIRDDSEPDSDVDYVDTRSIEELNLSLD